MDTLVLLAILIFVLIATGVMGILLAAGKIILFFVAFAVLVGVINDVRKN